MSQRHSYYPRKADEEYNTPPWVAKVIALWLEQQGVRSVIDPAPGNFQFLKALGLCGFEAFAPAGDFLKTIAWPDPYEALVTNPPFGQRGELAEAFIRHALKLEAPIAAFLLRVDFDSGKTRTDIFRDCPTFAGKIVLLDRIVWFERKGAKPSENHAWFIWDRVGYRLQKPWIEYAQRDVL